MAAPEARLTTDFINHCAPQPHLKVTRKRLFALVPE